MGETKQDAENDGHYDMSDAGVADEEYTRFVTIADRPADEIRVRLTSQSGFNHIFNERKCRWVSCMLKSVKDCCSVTVRKVEFSRRIGSKVMRDNAVDFRAEWLNRDCE